MKILHICNDFTGSKVHTALYSQLDMMGVCQTVYTYYDGRVRSKKNDFEARHTDFVYDDILKHQWRRIYPFKELWVLWHLRKKIDPKNYNCICATTMMSDGGVAYLLSKIYHIPYIVAVRATDIYTFLGRKLSWPFARAILLKAEKILIVTSPYQKTLSEHPATKKIWSHIAHKIIFQPNGLDDFWHQHISFKPLPYNHSICFVGKLNRNKNVSRLIDAVCLLKGHFSDIQLNIIGEGGTLYDEIKEKVSKYSFIHYLGPVYDKVKLKEVFLQNSVFAMPSIHETFGLVYLEALSQNLPVIYSLGEGIDGLFDNSVGIGVHPLSVNEISDAILQIFSHPERYGNQSVNFDQFRWSNIAQKYLSMYHEICNCKE